jgi:hypothetical protein
MQALAKGGLLVPSSPVPSFPCLGGLLSACLASAFPLLGLVYDSLLLEGRLVGIAKPTSSDDSKVRITSSKIAVAAYSKASQNRRDFPNYLSARMFEDFNLGSRNLCHQRWMGDPGEYVCDQASS